MLRRSNEILRKLREAAFNEIGATIALGIAALGALAFMLIADEANEGDTHQFDQSILLALREPGDLDNPVGPEWVELAFADITALGGYAVLTLLVVGVAAYLISASKRGSALLVVGAVVSGTVLGNLLKMGFDRPRPDLVAHLAHAQNSSFPSGHAMLSAVDVSDAGRVAGAGA